MTWFARIARPRMIVAILAAAGVFLLASGSLGGYDGASYAQPTTGQPANPGAPIEGGSPQTGELETAGPGGERQSCSTYEEARGGFLLGRIVPCLTKTIEHGGNRMSREMIELLRPTFYAFLTFVIVIFGVQVLQNEGQLQTRAFVLLLKIGFCLAVLQMIPGDEDTNEGGLIGVAYGIMAETQAVVMSSLTGSSDNISCEFERFGDDNTPMIWKQMDCLLSKLYGFTVGQPGPSGEARPNMLLASSVLGLAGGFFFNSSFGVALFLACLGMLGSMFMLVLRVLLAFLNSYMFIALYMVLAPLLLPLMFLKVTTSMFEKWYSGIIAALLLPMVICAYVVLALQVYDKLFFADDAMITKLFDNQIMDRARQLPKAACDTRIANDAGFRADATGLTQQQIYTNNLFLQNINPLVSATNNICGGMTATNLNLDGQFTGPDGQPMPANEVFRKLFFDVVKLFILSMLMNMGFTTIMGAVRPMLGSGAVVAAVETGTPMEQKLRDGLRGAQAGLRQGFEPDGRPTRGAEFIQRVPTAFAESGRGFLSGMGMNVPPANSGSAGGTAARGGAPANGASGGGAAAGGAAGGSSGGNNDGGDDGDSSSNSSSGGNTTARGGAGGSATGGNRTPLRSMGSAERREVAEAVLSGAELTRFNELEGRLYGSARMEPGERDRLNEEYNQLLDRIEELSNRGG